MYISGRGSGTSQKPGGFKVYLCRQHHIHAGGPEAVHRNHETCLIIQQDVQRRFEETHTREEFMALIGRNYL